MGYDPHRTLEYWKTQAYHAAPLGAKAVQDGIKEMAKHYSVEVAEVNVEYTRSRRGLTVSITHRDADGPPCATLQFTQFGVVNYRPNPITDWQEALADIKLRQDNMPPHLRGYPVDVDEATYRKQLDQIREDTGYEAALGDFAMWLNDKGHGFCYLTRAGEIAFKKWVEVRNIPTATRVYVIGDPEVKETSAA